MNDRAHKVEKFLDLKYNQMRPYLQFESIDLENQTSLEHGISLGTTREEG